MADSGRDAFLCNDSIYQGSGRFAVSSQVTGLAAEGDSVGDFGANEWLVDEMYNRYLADKKSVDESWWPILEGYHRTVLGAPSAGDSTAPPATEGGEPQIPVEVTG